MVRGRVWGWAGLVAAVALGLAGCGDDDPTSSTADPSADSASSTTAPADTSEDDASGDPGDVVTISGDQEHRVRDTTPVTILCDGGGEVDVEVDGAEVTVTGSCRDVDVESSEGRIDIDATGDLDVEGHRNTIDVVTVDDLDVSDDDNTITAGTISHELDVDGDRNTITFTDGSPEIDDDGSGNTISGP